MSKAQSTKIRVDEIFRLLLRGKSRRQILAWSEQQDWAAAVPTIDRYIASARKQLAEMPGPNRQEELRRHLLLLDELYDAAWESKDYKLCLAICDKRASTLGLSMAPGRRGPKPMSSGILAQRGSWRAKLNAAREADIESLRN